MYSIHQNVSCDKTHIAYVVGVFAFEKTPGSCFFGEPKRNYLQFLFWQIDQLHHQSGFVI